MAGLWTAFMYRNKKTLFDLTGLFMLCYITPCFILSAMWKYDKTAIDLTCKIYLCNVCNRKCEIGI